MQRGYAIALAAVLLVACGGAFLGGRLVWQQVQGGSGGQRNWTPPTSVAAVGDWTPAGPEAASGTDVAPEAPQATSTRRPPATLSVPTMEPIEYATPTEEEYALLYGTPTPGDVLTATVTVTPTVSSHAYVLARAVRNSSGDCPGSYVLGRVTDAAGNPLPNVGLVLVDEYGNRETTVTKPGPADAGRYDFPVYGPPRRFYVTVLDANGQPASPRAEVANGVGEEANATCHWVDWVGR